LAAEYFVTGAVLPASWSAVGVMYVAGVGLVSRNQGVLVMMLLVAAALAFVYGVDMKDAYDHVTAGAASGPPRSVPFVRWLILFAMCVYGGERAIRRLFEGKPFLETSP
jgi:hypothetical protein